jgi:hypothetical protein
MVLNAGTLGILAPFKISTSQCSGVLGLKLAGAGTGVLKFSKF